MNVPSSPESPGAGASGPRWAIADVERETGIGKDTLRVWERRYGFPVPRRDERGDRLYDDEQLGRLRLIRRLLDVGHRPGRVVGLPRETLEAWVAALDDRSAPLGGAVGEMTRWMQWLRQDQTAHLRQGLRAAVRARGLAETVEALVAPLCIEVGRAWLCGEIGVYQEHLFTEAVQSVLREAIASTEAAQPQGPRPPRVLLTTVPGEQHQLGLLMVECILALQGCDRLPLGVGTPLVEIAQAATRTAADVVALSFSGHSSRRDLVEAVTSLRARLPAPVELWIGGAAVQRHWKQALPGVVALRRAADAEAQVRAWRQQRGLA